MATVTAKQIFVHNKDFGFFTQEPITVQRKEVISEDFNGEQETDVVWCNHAEAEEVEEEHQTNNIDAPDMVWTDKALVCHKCKAYKFDGDTDWQNAPVEGVHDERN